MESIILRQLKMIKEEWLKINPITAREIKRKEKMLKLLNSSIESAQEEILKELDYKHNRFVE